MPRTTSDLVRGIYQSMPPDVDIDPYINVANVVVTDRLTILGYSDTKLEMIERLLTCHLFEVDNPRIMKEGQGNQYATEQLESKVDLGLNLTRFGQQIKLLDNLNGLGWKKPKSIKWLGLPFKDVDYRRGRL